ncbi:MAG TPA: 2,3-diphosphoglycerate-dependent phosphoglycerate mutase [Acidimicrobiia bacterium]|jgi:2,3-bisphosphoglycerate-dependent phosphoglycerate mutase
MSEATLVLLRHGQSEWNELNLFTGWVDVDLTELGRSEAVAGGEQLRAAALFPDVLHTSVQLRAIRTAELALDAAGRKWIPVRRSWRLNERHYGALQGKNKRETVEQFGAEQVQLWRRSYDVPPEPLDVADPHSGIDERYAALPRDVLPRAECLADVAARMLPYWYDAIVPDLRAAKIVLVAAHGNSLRALAQHLDGMTCDEVVDLNIPTGFPLVYELDANMQPAQAKAELGVRGRYLDPAGAERAIEGVKAQTQSPTPSA